MNIYSLHRQNFHEMPTFHFFGEQRKIYKAEIPSSAETETEAKAKAKAEAEAELEEKQKQANAPKAQQKTEAEKNQNIVSKKQGTFFNGPIPTIMGRNKGLLRNSLGLLLFPIEVGLRTANVGANSVAKAAATILNYGGPLVNGAVERMVGNEKSWKHEGYGSLGNLSYRGGVENLQRLGYGTLQTIQGITNSILGSVSTVLAGTKIFPKSLEIPEHALRPFAWVTDKIPLLRNINMFEGAKNIIHTTREKLRTPASLAWELAKQEGVNLKENFSGLTNNIKGAALSLVETPLRTITGAVGPNTDATIGSVISNTANKIQNSSFFSTIFGKGNLGNLTA